jgi:hypothetical protein
MVQNLDELVSSHFHDRVYTPAEFLNAEGDGGRWPSWQELVRRKKNWVVGLQQLSAAKSLTMFGATSSRAAVIYPPVSHGDSTRVVFNYDHDDDVAIPEDVKGDWWMTRVWPDSQCDDAFGIDEFNESFGEWDAALQERPTFYATNCVSHDDRNLDDRVHPHQPTYVGEIGDESNPSFGTRVHPYRGLDGLVEAVRRISAYGSKVDVIVQSGIYDVPSSFRLDGPMVLRVWSSANGPVTLK